ncbi:hypothetical protein L1049_001988 [Liquidambar formosana]|uniref:Uncharacterized protein n=1 Tax=Liquidambar formosana TaxID=63359 RepID=A0AAP0NGX4_LIQFO
MCLQKGEKPEIFNEFSEIGSEDVVKENSEEVEDQTEIPEKTTQADSPMSEKGKDDENPEQKVDGSFIKHEESKQIKIEGLVMTEASARENRNEDEFTVIEAEKEINNTEISKADEHRRNETSIHKEDPEQSFLQHDDPKEEKLERSLNVNSEMTEVAAPSENVETITCVQEGSSINNLEESFEEKEKEDKPTDTNEISEHGILREKNFQPIDLNEKIESAEIEIPEKNVNDSHVKHSLGGETEPMECEKHDKVSKFQPQEVNEANEASTEEVKQIEEASEGCKSTERTALGHTSTEEAATKELISSEKDAEELQKIYGLDSEEKSEVEECWREH